MGNTHNLVVEGGNGNYVPFDIENVSGTKSNVPDISVNNSNHEESPPEPQSSFSIANVLKTLILILVWYIFSTFLTLYNKTLLGDDLGKFPAPLLMNTVHFTMQAVLSKAITWHMSEKMQPGVKMSWRDYFLRDGLCISQWYPQLLEQLWI